MSKTGVRWTRADLAAWEAKTGVKAAIVETRTAIAADPKKRTVLAEKFEAMWEAMHGPFYVKELQVVEDRRFAFDYAWPEERVAVELQGGIYLAGKGGHVSPKGVKNDCDKLNLAVQRDWRVFKLATGQITPENVAMIRDTILALHTAPQTWRNESARLFALARQTGHARHAEAAKKAENSHRRDYRPWTDSLREKSTDE